MTCFPIPFTTTATSAFSFPPGKRKAFTDFLPRIFLCSQRKRAGNERRLKMNFFWRASVSRSSDGCMAGFQNRIGNSHFAALFVADFSLINSTPSLNDFLSVFLPFISGLFASPANKIYLFLLAVFSK